MIILNGISWVAITGSSNISRIGYNKKLNTLYVDFKGGGIYQYLAVPVSIWNKFILAQSKGRFFATNIRGKYETTKLN